MTFIYELMFFQHAPYSRAPFFPGPFVYRGQQIPSIRRIEPRDHLDLMGQRWDLN